MTEMLLDAARKTVPTLSANAARTEREMRPAPESVAAVRDAGLFALMVPREAGGHDVNLRTLVEVLAELGRGCPSTAWVVGLSASGRKLAGIMLSDSARDVLLSDPSAGLCASSVTRDGSGERVPGGLRVSGRWAMASGSEVATWALIMVPLTGTGAPAVCPTLVPLSDLSIERTWTSTGLVGTSSHTLVADDVLVPERLVTFRGGSRPSPEAAFTGGLAALARSGLGTSRSWPNRRTIGPVRSRHFTAEVMASAISSAVSVRGRGPGLPACRGTRAPGAGTRASPSADSA